MVDCLNGGFATAKRKFAAQAPPRKAGLLPDWPVARLHRSPWIRIPCARLHRRAGAARESAPKSNVAKLCATGRSYDLVAFARACARARRNGACLRQDVASEAGRQSWGKPPRNIAPCVCVLFRTTCISEIGPLRQQGAWLRNLMQSAFFPSG